jgi:large subunit ribosomal protein L23
MAAEKHNQVLFKVMRDATKPEIKAAVELMFKVTVDSVQTVQHKGKTKRFGKGSAAAITSRRPTSAWRRARS